MLPLCLFVLGEPPPAIAADLGRYPAWFEAITEGATLEAVDGVGGPEVDPRDWAGVVLTGSPALIMKNFVRHFAVRA